MSSLQQELSRDTRVWRYDRAGQGRSDPLKLPLTAPRTAADVVADLHALLQTVGVPGPFVLIGQSAGGVFVELYARTFPKEIAGVVSMNAVPPADPCWTSRPR
jgi:pimeloyl-ACP methyl ester carboxylesterase